jgi:hypothetical protein
MGMSLVQKPPHRRSAGDVLVFEGGVMTEVLYTDGNWRLALNQFVNLKTKACLEHKCPTGNYNGDWVAHRFNYFYFNVPCAWCGELAPEGLQGLFVMLTDDNLRTKEHGTLHHMQPSP